MKPTSPDKVAYILEHLNDMPRKELAKKVGVTCCTIRNIAHAAGIKLRKYRDPERDEIVRKYYPIMSGEEIKRRFGIRDAAGIAERLGVKHTEETEKAIRQKITDAFCKARKRMDEKKRVRTLLIRRRMDEMRLMQGEEQLTRMKFRTMPLRTMKAKRYLVRRRGYIAHPDDAYLMLYDENTRRTIPEYPKHSGTEEYYNKKYHLKFRSYYETEDNEESSLQYRESEGDSE